MTLRLQPAPPRSTPSLSSRLRAETLDAHRALEAGVGFSLQAPDRAAALRMLERFFGVLCLLEPRFAGGLPNDLTEGREKLHLLRLDLLSLGHTEDTLPRLAVPPFLSPLEASRGRLLGAMYVMEGSTLGGKLMARSLRRLPDWPVAACRYLDPYGETAGPMWTRFQGGLDRWPAREAEEVVAGALATFSFLSSWFAQEAET